MMAAVFATVAIMRIFLFLLTLSLAVEAAEVDQFTRVGPELADALPQLNRAVNQALAESVARANQPLPQAPKRRHRFPRQSAGCQTSRLYSAMSWNLARPVIGQIESFAEKAADIERRTIPLNQSVYRDFLWPQSPSLVLSERMAAVIRVGNTEIGTDKLGHFFTEGFSYFNATDYLRSGPEQGLLFGEWSESVYFGAQTTGVYSFADLVANFNGLRFWNRVLARQPDPLTGLEVQPYVECNHGQWVLSRSFSWLDYVDAAWDESRNCSLFRTLDLLSRVMSHAPECRADELPLARYGDYGLRLLNTSGPAVLPEHLQPEVILAQRQPVIEWRLSAEMIEHLRSLREKLEQWRTKQAQQLLDDQYE